MYLYLKFKSLYGHACKNLVPPKVLCPLPSRIEKVHAKKLPFVLVSNGILLAPKQKGNSLNDPIPSSLKGNSKPLVAI